LIINFTMFSESW